MLPARTKQSIQFYLTLAVGVMLVFLLLKPEKQYFPVSKQKTIEHRIQGKETQIQTWTKVIGNEKNIINRITLLQKDFEAKLLEVKNARDTFQIVQYQDTLIHVLYKKVDHLTNTVTLQDSVINAQRYIINSKDTIITVQKIDLKKIKRQRNWSLIGNGVLTGLLIIK
jgi:hypothetical protein